MVRKKRGNITRLTRSIFDTELYLGVRRRRLLDVDDVVCLDGGGGSGICCGGGLQVIQDICQCPVTVGSLSGIEIADNGITSIILSPFIAKLRLPRPRALELAELFRRAWNNIYMNEPGLIFIPCWNYAFQVILRFGNERKNILNLLKNVIFLSFFNLFRFHWFDDHISVFTFALKKQEKKNKCKNY